MSNKTGNWNATKGVMYSPDSFEVVGGQENAVNVEFTEEPCSSPSAQTGTLVLTVNTNGNGMTRYDINIGSQRSTGSGKWKDAQQIKISGLPAGEQSLSAKSCMGDFGGPSYSKGTVGIRPSSVNIPANGTAYADIDCNQGGGSAAKTQVTVVWEAKGCSAAKGGVILGANKYNIQFGESPSGSVTEEVAPGEYLVLANIGVRENSGNQVGEWKVPQDHSVSPISLTVTEGKTSTVTIKTSCDGSSVDQKGSVTLNWSATGCDGFQGWVNFNSESCKFGAYSESGMTGPIGSTTCSISPGSYILNWGGTGVLLPGEHNWSVPPTTPTITPKSVTVKAGQNTSVNISTSCDGSSEQCRPVPVTVNLSAQYNNLGTTPGSGGGFKVVGSASVSSASTTDISVSVSGSVVYVSTTPGSNMNGTQQFSGTLRIPAGQKMSSLVTLKEISNANAGQIMATAKATPENCVSGVTVNAQQTTNPPSAGDATIRIYSTADNCINNIISTQINIKGTKSYTGSTPTSTSSYNDVKVAPGTYSLSRGTFTFPQIKNCSTSPGPGYIGYKCDCRLLLSPTSVTVKSGQTFPVYAKYTCCGDMLGPTTPEQPDDEAGKVTVLVNISGVMVNSFYVSVPTLGSFTKPSTVVDGLLPGTYNIIALSGFNFYVKGDPKQYSCNQVSTPYKCTYSISPKQLKIDPGGTATLNIDINVTNN